MPTDFSYNSFQRQRFRVCGRDQRAFRSPFGNLRVHPLAGMWERKGKPLSHSLARAKIPPLSQKKIHKKSRKNRKYPLQIFRNCAMIYALPENWVAHADIAQQVERILGKDEVTSSNLVISSRLSPLRISRRGDFLCVFKGFVGFVYFSPDVGQSEKSANFCLTFS